MVKKKSTGRKAAKGSIERKASAPTVEQLTNVIQVQVELLKESLRTLEHADNLMTVSAKALREQDCDADVDVAETLERFAWPKLNETRGAICAVLRTYDPEFVKGWLGSATEAMDKCFAQATADAVKHAQWQEALTNA